MRLAVFVALCCVGFVVSSCASPRAAAERDASPTPSASATPTATPSGPIYIGNPATHFALTTERLGFDADGRANWRVTAHFLDAAGEPTRIMANSDVEWTSADGAVQWQTRMRFGQPSAILKTVRDGPIAMNVRVRTPDLGSDAVRDDTRVWTQPRVVAQAVGPHMIQVGWFPVGLSTRVKVSGADEVLTRRFDASASSARFDALPGALYHLVVQRGGRDVRLSVRAPDDVASQSVDAMRGKGMWLAFSTNPIDDDYAARWDVDAMVARAASAGLSYVELRTTYGAYWQLAPDVKDRVDALIDGLADKGIATIAWSVPRDTSIEDVSVSVQSAMYRTPRGTPVRGLAVDLERGDMFMGGDALGVAALPKYMETLRGALGPHALLVATVEDPFFEHLNAQQYAYAQIARFADVLQPMAYWRMMRRTPTTAADVRALLPQSVAMVRRLSGRALPVSIGGQTDAEGPNGRPSVDEITASLDAAKASGAIGECFFDWEGTQPEAWDALGRYAY